MRIRDEDDDAYPPEEEEEAPLLLWWREMITRPSVKRLWLMFFLSRSSAAFAPSPADLAFSEPSHEHSAISTYVCRVAGWVQALEKVEHRVEAKCKEVSEKEIITKKNQKKEGEKKREER